MEDDDFDDLLVDVDDPTTSNKEKSIAAEIGIQEASKFDSSGPSKSKDSTRTFQPKSHCILVNQKQRGNPLLKSIRSVPWEYDDILPDYEIGKNIGVLFISLRYHNMNPDYINQRLKELGKRYELRVLLVQVDLKEPHIPLKNITRICLLADLTLMLAWSPEEASNILENYKIFENKPPDKIMEKVENDPNQKIINALSSVKPVNKTDAMTLIKKFGTLEQIIKASEANLADCPGFGLRKAQKLYKTLHEPFLKKIKDTITDEIQENEFQDPDIAEQELEETTKS